jgi:hypothetical protein
MSTKEIKGIECKFVLHIPANKDRPDVHMVKERIHYTDGTTEPNIKYIKEFKRSLWSTAPSKRNHKQKKEWENLDNLIEKSVTQSELRNEIAKLVGTPWSRDSQRSLCANPYIYGTDISSCSLIKDIYRKKYANISSRNTVATLDIETDVLNGTEDVIMASVTMDGVCYTSVLSSFLNGISSPSTRVNELSQKLIGEYMAKFSMTDTLHIADDPVDLITNLFREVHRLKPDILAIWNMDFDVPRMLATIEKYNGDPKEIFCDPDLPYHMRICKYKRGNDKKVTAAGRVIPISIESRWHTFQVTASYYVLDAMCVYKGLRLGEQNENSYSLDHILDKKLGIRKLKFKEADDHDGLKWHQFMQANYKLEYIVYNRFDCISMLELDDKTKDLKYTFTSYCGNSDFTNFNSQPKLIADKMHFYLLEKKNHVVGTLGPGSKQDAEVDIVIDELVDGEEAVPADVESTTLDMKGWVLTLPSHMSVLGLACVKEDPKVSTYVRAYGFDSDSTAAYPTAIETLNVSKMTTKREIISIDGIDEDIFRMQNLNVVLGPTNSLEYSQTMFNLPKPQDLLKAFLAS